MVTEIPKECWRRTLSYLPPSSYYALKSTNKIFTSIVDEHAAEKLTFCQDFLRALRSQGIVYSIPKPIYSIPSAPPDSLLDAARDYSFLMEALRNSAVSVPPSSPNSYHGYASEVVAYYRNKLSTTSIPNRRKLLEECVTGNDPLKISIVATLVPTGELRAIANSGFGWMLISSLLLMARSYRGLFREIPRGMIGIALANAAGRGDYEGVTELLCLPEASAILSGAVEHAVYCAATKAVFSYYTSPVPRRVLNHCLATLRILLTCSLTARRTPFDLSVAQNLTGYLQVVGQRTQAEEAILLPPILEYLAFLVLKGAAAKGDLSLVNELLQLSLFSTLPSHPVESDPVASCFADALDQTILVDYVQIASALLAAPYAARISPLRLRGALDEAVARGSVQVAEAIRTSPQSGRIASSLL